MLRRSVETTGCSRLERTAAEEARSPFCHLSGGVRHLLFGFDRTRAGSDDKFRSADLKLADPNPRSFWTDRPVYEFVGSTDVLHTFDAG